MGLFSSSKSSKTENNTNQSAAFSEVGGDITSVNAANATVSLSDRKAIEQAFEGMKFTTGSAFEFATKTQEQLQGATQSFNEQLTDLATQQVTGTDEKFYDLAKWGIGAVVAVMAFNAYQGSKAAAS